jgi:hypothetical protein
MKREKEKGTSWNFDVIISRILYSSLFLTCRDFSSCDFSPLLSPHSSLPTPFGLFPFFASILDFDLDRFSLSSLEMERNVEEILQFWFGSPPFVYRGTLSLSLSLSLRHTHTHTHTHDSITLLTLSLAAASAVLSLSVRWFVVAWGEGGDDEERGEEGGQ